jgi:hypothetical protein
VIPLDHTGGINGEEVEIKIQADQEKKAAKEKK